MLFQDAMAEALVSNGVKTIFGLIGDGNLFVMDSFRRREGTTYIGVAHEATAVEAASGFAQVQNQLGVATVTHGPALTNAMTPLVEAVRGEIPVLLLAGDTKSVDSQHPQSIAQREIVLATGAGFEQLRSPETLGEDLAEAIRRVHAEKRPIVLNMPVDFQWMETERPTAPSRLPRIAPVRPTPDSLDDALGIIASANRPLIVAGKGAITDKARSAVLRFAERIGAPVGTTLKAHGLFSGEPHNLGIIGTLAHEVASDTAAAADCVVAFGASLNRYTTAHGSLTEGRRSVHVDNDARSLGRFVTTDATVLGDAAETADLFVALLDEAEIPRTGFATPRLASDLDTLRLQAGNRTAASAGYVDILSALRKVDAAVPADRTVVTDSGRFIFAAWTILASQSPRHFVHTANFAAIGLGMGTAIGAAVARPAHPTLLVTGDGGFMMGGMNELSTAIRQGLDLIVIVLNDGAYGAEHIQFVRRDLDPSMSLFDWPDLGQVAESLGARGFTVRSEAELNAALAYLPDRDRAVLIDVRMDPNAIPSSH